MIVIIFVCCFENSKALSFESKSEQVYKVFYDIAKTYGTNKPLPKLNILKNNQKIRVGAVYKYENGPMIYIDEQLIDICFKQSKDSLNSLAIILSHELAHYFNDHSFCTDYSFATKSIELAKKLHTINKQNQIEKEIEADFQGIWHASIAGYEPYEIFNSIIDGIYKAYNLPSRLTGYPTKEDRKEINNNRLKEIQQLSKIFDLGNYLIISRKYSEAISCYNYLSQKFPSRENYNNLGIAKLLLAMNYKKREMLDFIYPIEIDYNSRLSRRNITRSSKDYNHNFNSNVKSSISDFKKSIDLDNKYSKSYINLACAYDLIGNFNMSIGIIDELMYHLEETASTNNIKGIAYAHLGNNEKAISYFSKDVNEINEINKRIIELSINNMPESQKLIDSINQSKNNNNKILSYSSISKINNLADFTIQLFEDNIETINYKKNPEGVDIFIISYKESIKNPLIIKKTVSKSNIQNFNLTKEFIIKDGNNLNCLISINE